MCFNVFFTILKGQCANDTDLKYALVYKNWGVTNKIIMDFVFIFTYVFLKTETNYE